MPSVRGCNLPDDLLYDVENHIWFQEQGDGTVKIGMTAVATAMAGKLVAFTPKRVGRSVRAGEGRTRRWTPARARSAAPFDARRGRYPGVPSPEPRSRCRRRRVDVPGGFPDR